MTSLTLNENPSGLNISLDEELDLLSPHLWDTAMDFCDIIEVLKDLFSQLIYFLLAYEVEKKSQSFKMNVNFISILVVKVS